MGKIFERQRLSAAQMRMVAERRYDDADYLRKSGSNARANGVYYLGGIVIECLLKARLVEQYPTVAAQRDPAALARADRDIWNLIYRSHDLDEMLDKLPDLRLKVARVMTENARSIAAKLLKICGEWTIFARYSTHAETMSNASRFLDDVKELKTWLRH